MACRFKTWPRTQRPFEEGLLPFAGLWFFFQYFFEPGKAPRFHLEIQATAPAGLNLFHNPPTVLPHGKTGNVYKAVAYPTGMSRFCAFKRLWPFIRGRDGPG